MIKTLTGDPTLVKSGFDSAPNDPLSLFKQWLEAADSLEVEEPRALVLSTVDAVGRPSSRVIVIKALDEARIIFSAKQTWDEALYIMEGLATLRPKVLQSLLESCNSIKVKRIFLFLATHCNHAWVKNLDLRKIELGHGKRVIERHGFLDSQFKITVPKLFSSLSGDAP